MPKLNTLWKDIDEASGGGFSDIEPGAYVLTITACEGHPNDEYFEIAWDVAEGPRKGAYAASQYPPTTRIYWREKALGFLKHRLHVLADWNGGFQPTVAFDNDQWGQFVGKRFGAVVRKRLYTAGPNSKAPGADRYTMEVAAWLSPEDFRAGKFNPDLLKDNDMRRKAEQAAPTPPVQAPEPLDLYAEDVPF